MAEEIICGIPVILVFQRVVRFKDRGLAEIAFEGREKIGGEIIEVGIIGTVKGSPPCHRKIKSRLPVQREEVVDAGILDIIGEVWILEKIGIAALSVKSPFGNILVHIKNQTGELIFL